MALDKITSLLGADAEALLSHTSTTVPKENIMAPGGDFVDRAFVNSARNPQVLRSLQQLYGLLKHIASRSGHRAQCRCFVC
jgi:class I fructose-bisphosphate aldolase